jgi:carboxypeptidase T
MKPIKATLLLACLFLCAGTSAFAQRVIYSQVKIPIDATKPEQQHAFIFGELQIDHCHFEDENYVVEIGSDELTKLKSSPYRYELLVDDIAKRLEEKNATRNFYQSDINARNSRTLFQTSCRTVEELIPTPAQFTPGGMGGYYTYAEMVTKIGWLYDNFPALVDTFSIGRTGEGRDIWCVKISDNVLTDELTEPEVSYNALQHAREAISGTSLIFFMQYLTENYATDSRVRALVDNRQIYLIPCTNPDGYVYNQTTNPGGGGNWRKNRRPLGGGEFGVDLNRNYNADWGRCGAPIGGTAANCGTGAATSANSTYWGTGPFSEPETRAIRDFTAQRRFRMSIDQHSEGSWNTTPHGRIGLHPGGPTGVDRDFLYGFSSSTMATYNCHRIGNNLETLFYEVAGGNKDWMFQGDTSMTVNPRKIYAFTSEAGGGSFWPAIDQIIPLAKGLTFQFLQAALAAGSYADIQDVSDASIPAMAFPFNGNMNYTVRRVGILDAPITVALIPLQNIGTVGSPVVINSIAAYNGAVSGSIPYTLHPSITAGQVVKFLWRVTTGGIVTNDTVTKIYSPTPLFYDDMETTGNFATNWAATGAWGYTTTQAYAGTRSVSESPVGQYPANATSTLTSQSTYNLSDATGAYLSFWVRHRSENCSDNLRIQVSRDATTVNNGTYFNLCGQHTISENKGTLGGQPALTGIRENWTRELINLAPYIGAGNGTIRLRFSFTSNNNDNFQANDYDFALDDGFSIDNVRLIKTTTTLVTLPVKFLWFEGKLISNGRAELTWGAETDGEHDYFEIERSVDRNNFISLGRTVNTPPYKFIDPSVQVGNNYYRIKQLDKNGRVTYSNIINIFYKPGLVNMVVYPNPVTDYLKIKINATTAELYTVQIADLAGRTIHKEKIMVGSMAKELNINFKAQASQVYVLTIRNSNNEVINTQKIIKQ